jgi:hypothetical protein
VKRGFVNEESDPKKVARCLGCVFRSLVESSSSLGKGEFSSDFSRARLIKEIKGIFEKEGPLNHAKIRIPPCFVILNNHCCKDERKVHSESKNDS